MKIKALLTIPGTILAVATLTPGGIVWGHDGVAFGTCNGGVTWNYHDYDANVVNSIAVTIDGTVRYHDGDFKSSDTGAIATDKTQPHTWSVDVNAPGTQFDKHPSGSYAACVVPPTTTTTVTPTTTLPPTTTTVAATTTLPESTTTEPASTVPCDTSGGVASCFPPVPPTTVAIPPSSVADVLSIAPEPGLPRTGLDGDDIAGIAVCVVILGSFLILVAKGRRHA